MEVEELEDAIQNFRLRRTALHRFIEDCLRPEVPLLFREAGADFALRHPAGKDFFDREPVERNVGARPFLDVGHHALDQRPADLANVGEATDQLLKLVDVVKQIGEMREKRFERPNVLGRMECIVHEIVEQVRLVFGHEPVPVFGKRGLDGQRGGVGHFGVSLVWGLRLNNGRQSIKDSPRCQEDFY